MGMAIRNLSTGSLWIAVDKPVENSPILWNVIWCLPGSSRMLTWSLIVIHNWGRFVNIWGNQPRVIPTSRHPGMISVESRAEVAVFLG